LVSVVCSGAQQSVSAAAFLPVQGGTLTIEEKNGKFLVIDAKGDNVMQSNGVIQVINTVMQWAVAWKLSVMKRAIKRARCLASRPMILARALIG
jgi:hypothetical protein